MRRRFGEEDEVEQILRLAMREESADSALRQRLLASAAELGIPEEAALAAERQWRTQRRQQEQLDEFGRGVRKEFYAHLWAYLLVNAFLFAINLLTGGGHLWALYVLVGWGVGLGGHAIHAFSLHRDPTSKEFREWLEKRQTLEEPRGT